MHLLSNLSLFGQVFLFRNYTAAEGLPDDFVFQIRQDSRGYMWFATSSGISRYDGVHFQNYSIKNGLPDNAVRDLLEDEQGRIWVATASGLSCFEGGQFRNYSTADGLPHPFIQCLYKGRDGRFWIGTRGGGVCYFDGKNFHRLDEDSGFSLKTIWDIRGDQQGNVWFCGQEGGVFRFDGKKFQRFSEAEGIPPVSTYCTLEDRQGNIWVGTDSGVYRHDGTKFRRVRDASNTIDDVSCMIEDPAGAIWFASYGGGLVKYEKGKYQNFRSANGLVNDYAICLFVDRESNLWIGTQGGGASKFSGEQFAQIGQLKEAAISLIHGITQDPSGQFWFASYGGGICRLNDDGRLDRWRTSQGLASNLVNDVVASPSGKIYCGTDRGLSVFEKGRFQNFDAKTGLPDAVVRALYLDQTGKVWIGTFGGGVCRFDGKRFENWTTREGLLDNQVISIHEDQLHRIWLGTGKGVSILDNGHFRNLARKEGLPAGKVAAITESPVGVYWIGTDTGLCRYENGQFTIYDESKGLTNSTIHWLQFDRQGALWMGTNKGISRLTPASGQLKNFSSRDGLAGDEMLQGAVFLDRTGFVWCGSTHGATRFDPAFTPHNFVPPIVQIDGVRIFDQEWPLTQLSRLSPRQNSMTFSFLGLSFRDEERVQYRYLLEGFDPQWSPGTRERSARYTNLPEGKYRFRVTAANSLGIWDEKGASLEFEILPPLYRKLWFQCLAGFFLLVSMGGIVQWRTWMVRQHNLKLDRKVRERTREVLEQRERLARTNQELQALQDTSNAIIGLLDPDKLGHLILETSMQLLVCPGGVLMELGWPDQKVIVKLALGTAAPIQGAQFPAQQSQVWELIESRQACTFSAGQDDAFLGILKDQAELASCQTVLVPMICMDRMIGILALVRPFQAGKFNQREIALLVALASQATVAIRNADLYQAIRLSENRYRTLVERAGDAIFVVTREGCFDSVNPKTLEMLGYAEAEFKQMQLADIVPEEQRGVVHHLLDHTARSGNALESVDLQKKNGDSLPVEIHMVALGDDLYQAIVRDITMRRFLEKTLKQQRDRAEEASRLKSEFLASVSHELRTPLHAILSYADFGLEKISTADRGRLRNYFHEIKDSGSHLLTLIDDLLDLSKIEAGKMVYQWGPVTLWVVLDEACSRLGNLAESRQISLKTMPVPKDWIAWGDYEKILRLLINILGNAIKFTPVGGQISLFVKNDRSQNDREDQAYTSGEKGYHKKEAEESNADASSGLLERDFWHVGIQDTGIGIHPDEREAIFEKFVQSSHHAANKSSGTGLGLSICRGIVEAHQGKIWVESPGLGLGSTFYFSLPVYRESAASR